jgi:type IV pilus assembly protein PilY1
MPFPACNEDINTWTAQTMFLTDAGHTRKFFYPPSITLEKGYDLVFMGTGDRENACSTTATNPDMIYCVKDTHSGDGPLVAEDLVDVTNEASTVPDLNDSDGDVDENGNTDEGWYIRLVDSSGNAVGEKVLAKGSVFYKVFYLTTFTPNDDACQPGGEGKLYALDYLTGAKAIDLDGDASKERSLAIGGGIPSTPVMVITDTGVKQFIAVGSTNPDESSPDVGAGILGFDPKFPAINFFYLWWNEY